MFDAVDPRNRRSTKPLGLILPALLRIRPELTPLAAAGLVIIMIGATVITAIQYFPSAAAAEAAGFRPCLRCRPEASPGTPAWIGTSGLVSRALRLISEGALDDAGVERLADRLGVTGRHLRRLFLQHLGATPLDVALTRRTHFAKKLLDETTLAMHDVALASGFGSLRRFNSQVRRTYRRTPTELRRLARRHVVADPECYRFRLAYRPPYDWDAVLDFLSARATPGVECVEDGHYRRTIQIDEKSGAIDVSRHETLPALHLTVGAELAPLRADQGRPLRKGGQPWQMTTSKRSHD